MPCSSTSSLQALILFTHRSEAHFVVYHVSVLLCCLLQAVRASLSLEVPLCHGRQLLVTKEVSGIIILYVHHPNTFCTVSRSSGEVV